MLKSLTYKKKLQLLVPGGVIVLLTCYRLAIAATIREYKTYSSLTGNELTAGVYSLVPLETKEKQINRFLSGFMLDTLDNSKNLLAIVSDYCRKNELLLKEYQPLALQSKNDLDTFTRMFTIEGRFVQCLQLVYALENQYRAGRVSSVLYKSYIDAKDKSTHLTCTIYIQNLIEQQHEIH